LAASSFGGAGTPSSFDAIFFVAGDADAELILNKTPLTSRSILRNEEVKTCFEKLWHYEQK
jgi:hypothetical protein